MVDQSQLAKEITFVVTLLFFAAAIIAIVAVGVMLAWAWVVADILEGSVKAGLYPASLTFWQALKLTFVLSIGPVIGAILKRR